MHHVTPGDQRGVFQNCGMLLSSSPRTVLLLQYNNQIVAALNRTLSGRSSHHCVYQQKKQNIGQQYIVAACLRGGVLRRSLNSRKIGERDWGSGPKP